MWTSILPSQKSPSPLSSSSSFISKAWSTCGCTLLLQSCLWVPFLVDGEKRSTVMIRTKPKRNCFVTLPIYGRLTFLSCPLHFHRAKVSHSPLKFDCLKETIRSGKSVTWVFCSQFNFRWLVLFPIYPYTLQNSLQKMPSQKRKRWFRMVVLQPPLFKDNLWVLWSVYPIIAIKHISASFLFVKASQPQLTSLIAPIHRLR